MSHPVRRELVSLAVLALVGLVLGGLFGHPLAGLFVTSAALLGWYVLNLSRMWRWLRLRESYEPPNVPGLWGAVFNEYHRTRRRHRRRRKRLTALLARFRDSTAAMPEGAAVLDANAALEWWNEAARACLGLRNQDAGQRITNLVRHPAFTEYVERGEFTTPVEFPCPVDETRTLSAVLVPYGSGQYLLMLRDVTGQLRVEQMRQDFVANVSHELRTPLTVVSGFVETLRDADDVPETWRRTLELMQQQTERMQHLVEDLLLLSRLENSPLASREPVPVPALLAAIREQAVVLSGAREHRITLDADPDLYLLGDARELDSAFMNLVANAVRYTPAGGEIEIRWWADQEHAHLAVRDTGIGVPAKHLSRVTERFYRVDVGRSRDSGGTGLGLAIVKHVLKRHKGELRIKSVPGKGSTFTCDFPLHVTAPRPVRQSTG